ncbi:MAG: MBL fold metallo-hydrolase [Gammaproteobacteria bacterium]|nr:MBL fold metallo-hydrolase [Gammaproteobacteria bacterium]
MPTLHRHPHDITAVDVEYQYHGHCAAHVIVQDGRALIVDVGPNDAVPLLLAALGELGVAPDAVDYVFLTHVHLDHAGGAGALLRQLPRARALLHPRGAPHMIDPAKLIAGSKQVYGEAEFQRLYGQIVPIPAGRVDTTRDAERVRLGRREFDVLHTPGHALHHHTLFDRTARAAFTGDVFGVSYRSFDTARGPWALITATPTQFDPEQMRQSIDRIVALEPDCVYLTHFSRLTAVPQVAAELRSQIAAVVALARHAQQAPDRHTALATGFRALVHARLAAHGCTLPAAQIDRLLGLDMNLSAQGLEAWLDRQR